MTKPEEKKLKTEVKTNITATEALALEAIAARRGRLVKVRDLIREKLYELIDAEFPEGFTPPVRSIAEDAPGYGAKKKPRAAPRKKR